MKIIKPLTGLEVAIIFIRSIKYIATVTSKITTKIIERIIMQQGYIVRFTDKGRMAD